MKLLEKIKTRIDARIRPAVISVFSGLLLIAGWTALDQNQAATSNSDPKNPDPGTANAAAPQQNAGPYKDGTYQASSPTPWGDYSISVEIKNGYWVNVNNLSIPDSPPTRNASTYLARQALLAQNSAIDGISGATYSAAAFRDDLNQIIQQSKI